MKKSTIITLISISILFIIGMTTFTQYRSVYDKNVSLTSDFNTAKEAVEINFATMTRTLKDQFKLTDKQSDKAIEYATALMEGRYSKGDGTLMKWITEQNPTLSQDNYNKLMDNIESLRREFEIKQDRVIAIKNEHNKLRLSFWSSIWLGDVKELEYTVISTHKAKEVMKTGNDDTDMYEDDKK